MLQATGNWFRENWSLAHELGHLVAKHHADGLTQIEWDRHESAANSFAAELLLPDMQMRAVTWHRITERELANLIWDFGGSTDALTRRLDRLNITVPDPISNALALTTQKLLRRHWVVQHADRFNQITKRMDEAATRRFPLELQETHTDLIASGSLHMGSLAWMLGIDPDALEIDEPPPPEPIGTDQLAAALGFSVTGIILA